MELLKKISQKQYIFVRVSIKNVKFYDPLAGSLRKTPTWFYLFLQQIGLLTHGLGGRGRVTSYPGVCMLILDVYCTSGDL